MNLKPLITVLIGGLALILTIASAAGVGWVSAGTSVTWIGTNVGPSDIGILRSCTEIRLMEILEICGLMRTDDTLRTCQAFIIIAILVNIVACFAGVYLVLRDSAITPLLVAALYAVAAFSCLMCGAVYVGKFKLTSGAEYGWGFALCWVSMILYIVAAVLSFVFRDAAEVPAAA